jgi:surfeit locus 1 family protein
MPRWKLIVAIAAGTMACMLAASLGNWQTRRGDAKAALQAKWDAAERAPAMVAATTAELRQLATDLPRRVLLRGTFVSNATVYVDNRIVDGVAGFFVVTPLALADRHSWVLVNRGWVARSMTDRDALPAVPAPDAPVTIEGLAVERVPRLLEVGAQAFRLGGIWQNLDFDEFERVSGHSVMRLVIQQTSASEDGLRRVWPRPDSGVAKHRGYAFQWYGLAALIAGLTVYFGGKALRAR